MVNEVMPAIIAEEDKKTTIPIKMRTRDRIKAYGKKGESWDGLMNRIMDDIAIGD
jgi:hypothetical protein